MSEQTILSPTERLELLVFAISDLIVAHESARPQTKDEYHAVGKIWQAIDRLTRTPIPIPGEDATVWTHRLREVAWEVNCAAKLHNDSAVIDALRALLAYRKALERLLNEA